MPMDFKTRSLTFAALIAAAAQSFAADPADVVKMRKGFFSALGGHTTAVGTLAKGVVDAPEQIEMHAAAIAELTAALARDTSAMWPEGSLTDKSQSLPAIWEDWDKFQAAADRAAKAGAEFREAAMAGNAGRAMRKLGAACKNCHDDFRERDE